MPREEVYNVLLEVRAQQAKKKRQTDRKRGLLGRPNHNKALCDCPRAPSATRPTHCRCLGTQNTMSYHLNTHMTLTGLYSQPTASAV